MTDDKVLDRALDPRASDDHPDTVNALRAFRRMHKGKTIKVVDLSVDQDYQNPLRYVVNGMLEEIEKLEERNAKLEARLKRIFEMARDK